MKFKCISRFVWIPLLAVVLASCGASPAPEFSGASRVNVSRGGFDYAVFYTENRFEIIRLGYASSGQHAMIRSDMLTIASETTGCNLIESSINGDSGEMRGSMVCPKQ